MRLANDIVIEHIADVTGRGHAIPRLHQAGLVLLADNIHAELDAFVTDENRRPGDEFAHLMLALAAERAVEGVLGLAAARLTHDTRFASLGLNMLDRRQPGTQRQKSLPAVALGPAAAPDAL